MILIHTNCNSISVVPYVNGLKWKLFYFNFYENSSSVCRFSFWIEVSLWVLLMFKTINVPKGKKYNMQPIIISFIIIINIYLSSFEQTSILNYKGDFKFTFSPNNNVISFKVSSC
jgi:hypothetical protein